MEHKVLLLLQIKPILEGQYTHLIKWRRKNRIQVNERIVEQYEYRMGDYTESSCAVLNHGMEWKLGAQGTCSRSQGI